ncbi:hypothetical protein I317_01395 [Kwoniella heveanensis CBS 569]|nr:hypothetical protein I317_01395 [Kwoniella heveanensis CBS 569]
MGVPGLWDLLRPAAARTSLSALSREAFHANPNGLRAFRVGIDASIWIFHAQVTHYGENPFLRTIFFKITALLQQPVLPVFVFDGPNKPGVKRHGSVKGKFGTADHKSKQFKALLDACGLEWWTAPGEAEAELAVMNRQGKIDAVLSDDVDALLFGATCLLRNNSPTLSGAQASTTGTNSARGDMRHYEVYRSSAIRDMWLDKEGTTLKSEEDCRMAMVLIALLSGGDYTPEGLPSIGPTISFGLANSGLSDFLKKYNAQRSAFTASLPQVHERIIDELRTNASKQVGRRYPKRADDLAALSPENIFPEDTLDAYLNPCTSSLDDPSQGWPGFGQGESVSTRRGKARNEGRGDMEGMARACETYFEWGTKEIVCKKFAGESVGVFGAEVVNEARELVRARAKARETRSTIVPSASPPLPLVHQSVGTSQAASSSRITSFFQQAASSSSQMSVKTSQPASQLQPQPPTSQPTPSDDDQPPAHIIKIHSVRTDPMQSDLSLNEYRVAFRHAGYVDRCQKAMSGSRSDPADLSDNSRQRLGLREREIDPDNIAEQGDVPKTTKDEIRVWMAEYLVREAWPGLVKVWEDEQAAKANKLLKKKKPAAKATKNKYNPTPAHKGVDTAAFAAFFSRAQPLRPRSASPTDEEEEEQIERASSHDPAMSSSSDHSRATTDQIAAGGKKSRARPCPTSSLSSLPEAIEKQRSKSPSASSRAKARSKSRRTSTSLSGSPISSFPLNDDERPPAATSAKRSPSPKPRAWPFGKRIFSKSKSSPSALASPRGSRSRKSAGGKDAPIDLCSTDSEDQTPVKPASRSRRRSTSKDHTVASFSAPIEGSDVETPKVRPPRSRKVKDQAILSSPAEPPPSNIEPIEISSDAESPVVRRSRTKRSSNRIITSSPLKSASASASTAALQPSSRANTLSPSFDDLFEMLDSAPETLNARSPSAKHKRALAPKPKSKNSTPQESSRRSTLSLPADTDHRDAAHIARDGAVTAEATIVKPKSGKKTPSPKKHRQKKTHYVVVSETSDEEEIDCTRRR